MSAPPPPGAPEGAASPAPADTERAEAAIRAVDPRVRVVASRVLRRIIKRDRGLSGVGLQVPHQQGYVVSVARARAFVEPDELDARPAPGGDDRLLLLERPEPDVLEGMDTPRLLRRYWRVLFHLRVHVALEDRAGLDPGAVRQRIDAVGQTAFDEVRAVLAEERLLFPDPDPREAWVEFAAVLLELRAFDPGLVAAFFPSLDGGARAARVLAADLDAAALLAATRPQGAPEPRLPDRRGAGDDAAPAAPDPGDVRSTRAWRACWRRASEASRRGHHARAAVHFARAAARGASERQRLRARGAASGALGSLARTLVDALGRDGPGEEAWAEALAPVADLGAPGGLDAASRLLYDVQRAAEDARRDVFDVRTAAWLGTLGRRPLVRPLPLRRPVLLLEGLQRARRRLDTLRLRPGDRARLRDTLDRAVDGAVARLRAALRPPLEEGLAASGLVGPPDRPLPLEAARRKLVEELLDRVVERGFLTLGDLRDSVSGGDLKVPDLSGPGELLRGDPLLRADRALARRLPGVYRRGEIYFRALLRASSTGFGTRPGRWLTLFAILPLAGSYVLLEGAQHLLVNPVAAVASAEAPQVTTPPALLALAAVILALLHSAEARRAGLATLRLAGRGLRAAFVDLPRAIADLPPVRWLRRQPWLRAAWRLGARPALLAAAVGAGMEACGARDASSLGVAGAVALSGVLLAATRLGRTLEELAADAAGRAWRRTRYHLLPGLVRLVLDHFRAVVEALERRLYAVDQWLRYRRSDPRALLAVKAALAPAWAGGSYLVRLYVNLLIEPQVNPIKHFPVVTVAHKLLLPFFPAITSFLATPLQPLGAPLAATIAGSTVFLLPGVAGFLAWELRANWRLYAANRHAALAPVPFGHHGETVERLLRPGLHSGTLPKLFRRLRRAERRGHLRAAHRAERGLHDVERAVRRFVERELVELLRLAPAFRHPLEVEGIVLGSNRVVVALAARDLAPTPAWISLEEQSGLLVAGVAEPGWLAAAGDDARATFAAALAGLYAKSGVDLVREQVEALLGGGVPYDVADEGLVLWPGDRYATEVIYPLRRGEVLAPRTADGPARRDLPALDGATLRFDRHPVSWRAWVAAWDRGAAPPPALHPGRLLPPAPAPG